MNEMNEMKVAIGVGAADSGKQRTFNQAVEYAMEAERMGVDFVWTAEAWGMDAVAPLAYIGAKTTRIRLGTGIMQVSARVPVNTAMTALTMASITEDRFVLGLGASGPQVVEGLHGRPFAAPLARMRETVEIVRLAFAGEKIQYDGAHHTLPLPGGEGKPIRLALPPNPSIPIYLATLAPKSLEYTGAAADGWIGTSFIPEQAEAHLAYIRAGAERAGRSLADIDIQAGGLLAIGENVDELIDMRKPGLAFQLGAMGSAQTNFYNDAFQRAGFVDACEEVRRLWKAGQREAAVRTVPDELVLMSGLVGTPDMVAERMRLYRAAGVNTLRLDPQAASVHDRIAMLEQAMDLVRGVNAADTGSASG